MEVLFPSDKATQVKAHMRQTTGTFTWHRHWLGMLFTDGIEYVCEVCEAHWLTDLVASWQPEIRKRHYDLRTFQTWRLEHVKGTEWVIEAWSDTPKAEGSTMLARQKIPYSDFPEDLSPFVFWVRDDMMMLKEEN